MSSLFTYMSPDFFFYFLLLGMHLQLQCLSVDQLSWASLDSRILGYRLCASRFLKRTKLAVLKNRAVIVLFALLLSCKIVNSTCVPCIPGCPQLSHPHQTFLISKNKIQKHTSCYPPVPASESYFQNIARTSLAECSIAALLIQLLSEWMKSAMRTSAWNHTHSWGGWPYGSSHGMQGKKVFFTVLFCLAYSHVSFSDVSTVILKPIPNVLQFKAHLSKLGSLPSKTALPILDRWIPSALNML